MDLKKTTLGHNSRNEYDFTSSLLVYRYIRFYSMTLQNGDSDIWLHFYTLYPMVLRFIILHTAPDDGSNVNRNMLHMYYTFYSIYNCVVFDGVLFYFYL
jgi:hypothetical protein